MLNSTQVYEYCDDESCILNIEVWLQKKNNNTKNTKNNTLKVSYKNINFKKNASAGVHAYMMSKEYTCTCILLITTFLFF